MNNSLIILLVLLLIILIEYSVKKEYIGIIILHNNDHTLNKVLQNIMSFMNNHLIHYQILVIKQKNPKLQSKEQGLNSISQSQGLNNIESNNRSTGYLFNIGMRQLSGFNNYLFIDTIHSDLKNFFTIHKSKKFQPKTLFNKDSINYYDKICAISLSKQTFKEMDGFSNKSNKNFNEFIRNLEKIKKKNDGYFSMNLDVKYDIVERTMVNPLTTKITIKTTYQ